jgi:Fe-S oxidoreductase
MLTATDVELCALCPQLCRHVCPVAVGTGREAATPTAIATTLLEWIRGESGALAAQAATLCTDCGACEAACGIDRPVITQLRAARVALLPSAKPQPITPVQGGASMVAIECDDRAWADALASHLGHGVAHMQTRDHLGQSAIATGALPPEHIAALRDQLGGRTAVAACQGCADALQAAHIDVVRLSELLDPIDHPLIHRPCNSPCPDTPTAPLTLACCGAGGPLPIHHPEAAKDLGRAITAELGSAEMFSPDTRCANHLRRCGARIVDTVDQLLGLDRN